MATKQHRSTLVAQFSRVEAYLSLGLSLAFLAWTALLHAGTLDALDHSLHAPVITPRSATGQIAEAYSLLTHPLIILVGILICTIFAYRIRMLRLTASLTIAATSIPLCTLLAWQIGHPPPGRTFADSISAFANAYPSVPVMATTVAAWVLVTLMRAYHRGSSGIAAGSLLGYGFVTATTLSQWLLKQTAISDMIGGLLLGTAVANIALWVGGIDHILTAWINRPRRNQATGKQAAIIYNPTKFDDLSLLRRRIEAQMCQAGWRPVIWLETTPDDPGHELSQRALKAQVDLVLVGGGDGTVRAVSSELAGTHTPLALIPAGTGNLLARNLAIPFDTDAAIRLALHGQVTAIDVVNCEHDDGKERFVVMAGMGLDAQIMEATDASLKKVIRTGAYAVAAVQNAVPNPFTATITLDNDPPTEHQIVMALLGNIGTLSRGMTLFPQARPTDGYIDILLASPDKVTDWAKLGAQIFTGQEMKGFTITRAKKIRIQTPEPVAFELDGDTIGATSSLKITVEPASLRVVTPAK